MPCGAAQAPWPESLAPRAAWSDDDGLCALGTSIDTSKAHMLSLSLLVAAYYTPPQFIQRAPVRMMADDTEAYWQTKTSRAQILYEAEEAALDELQARESLFLDQLRTLTKRALAAEEELEKVKQLGAAAAPPTSPFEKVLVEAPPAPAASEGDANLLNKLSEVAAEADLLREQLNDLQMKQSLQKAQESGPATSGDASKDAQRVAELEAELDGLEVDYENLAERLDVQTETITLANMRLDEVAAALEAQALSAEQQLQRTSAFWLDKLNGAKAEAAEAVELREALEAAKMQREVDLQKTSAFWIEKVKRLTADAEAAAAALGEGAADSEQQLVEELFMMRGQVSLLAQALESQALQAEQQLQRSSAFWIDKLKMEKADATATAEAAAAMKAEQQLQATAAFWIEKLAAAKAEAKAAAAAEAAMRAERELQATAAFWIARDQEQRQTIADLQAKNGKAAKKK